MEFYKEISKYYDLIFPVGKEQLKFIKDFVGMPPKNILDVACGTGGYSLELAKEGYDVTAVDLDYKMIEELKVKAINDKLNIKAFQGNMLELTNQLNSKFNLSFCIGNSLVHLDGEKEIEKFLKEAKGLLIDDGSLVIQIINYDRILMKDVRSLPTIENEEVGLKFTRMYRYDQNINKVFFKTILEVQGKQIENEIALYPLLADNAIKLLKNAGFNKIKLYGDFKGNEFDKCNSYVLVVVAS